MKIGRDLMSVAGKALRQNITELGPRVLPLSEQLIFAGNFVARKVRTRRRDLCLPNGDLSQQSPPQCFITGRPLDAVTARLCALISIKGAVQPTR